MLMVVLAALVAQDRPVMLPAPDTAGEPLTASEKCRPGQGEEITVCARSGPSAYRITRLEPKFSEKPIRAEGKIPGLGVVRVHADQRSLPGASAPAAMVSLTIPLGGKKQRDK